MTSIRVKPIGKITRTRLVTSCGECSRRKQKCNKKWPCNHCLGRKSPNLCQFGTHTPKEKQNSNGNVICEPSQQGSDVPQNGSEEQVNIDSSSTVLEGILKHKDHDRSTALLKAHDLRRFQDDMLKYFPKRATIDMLVHHFLQNVNWLYEEVHAVSFLEQYDMWWNQTQHQTDADIQFAILILRISVNSLQFLPQLTAETALEGRSATEFENSCNKAAARFDTYRPRKPTLLRVRQLLLHIATLLNDGDAKESHNVLGEAIKEARGVGLFLETQWTGLSEYEKDERRKLFWYLYVWDRFHCTFLGRWPLIPDHYHSVRLPSETLWSISSMLDAPTQFTDVLLNFKLNHYMASFISAPGKESERTNPYTIAAHAKDFQLQFVDTLPPCFRLLNPDTSWDTIIPSLPKKRLAFHIALYGVIEGMHKCFVGPLTPNSIKTYITQLRHDEDRAKLAFQHRHTLAQSCIDVLITTRSLHIHMGGGPHRYFVICVATIEASAMLGMMIISDLLVSTFNLNESLLPRELLLRCHVCFQEGIRLLRVLALNSALAQKGLRILEGFEQRISGLGGLEVGDSKKTSDYAPNRSTNHKDVQNTDDFVQNVPVCYNPTNVIGDDIRLTENCLHTAGTTTLQTTAMHLQWENDWAGNDISYFLEDWNSYGDGCIPDLFEIGENFS